MIIWLASYPKSGNTWVRSIVSALAYSNDGVFNMKMLSQIPQFPRSSQFKDFDGSIDDINVIKKFWIKAQEKINHDNKLYFLKTHHANIKIENYSFTNRDNTIGTIYIVRDPRNIISSISNHFGLTQKEAKNFIFTGRALKEGSKDNKGIQTIIGTWEEHYNSWTKYNDNLLLIKYEDLINNINDEIIKISKFVSRFTKINVNDEKIKKIAETTNFKNLSGMEDEGMFDEYKDKKRKFKFFNKGPSNSWQKNLDKNIKIEIEEKYSNLMKKLDYI